MAALFAAMFGSHAHEIFLFILDLAVTEVSLLAIKHQPALHELYP
jgi:hypothetical protein